MKRNRFILPQTSLVQIERIIETYYQSSKRGKPEISSEGLSKETQKTLKSISYQDVSGSVSFLRNLKILVPGHQKHFYTLSDLGLELGEAILRGKESKKSKCWEWAVNNSSFIRDLVELIRDSKIKEDALIMEILERANREKKDNSERGAITIIQVLLSAKIISKIVSDHVNFYEINTSNTNDQFIRFERIIELKNLNNPFEGRKYDLSKLIKLCEQININYDNDCYYAVGLLIRAIQDHIPPVFNKDKWVNVVSQYGGRSMKEHLKKLDEYRYTFDLYAHSQLKAKEDLANEIQVDCRASLDILLGEVIAQVEKIEKHPKL